MFKIITKRVLSCVVILCLSLSSLGITAYSNSEPPAKVSQIKKVLTNALALDTQEERDKASEYLTGITSTTTVSDVKTKISELLGITLTDSDISVLLAAFKDLTINQKAMISVIIKDGYTLKTDDFSKFGTIAKRINKIVTNDENDNNGTRFMITLLEQLARKLSLTTVYDLGADKTQIEFAIKDEARKNIVNSMLSKLLVFVEELPNGLSNGKADDFLLRAQTILNGLDKDIEIMEFKNFLEEEDSVIYAESKIIIPTPSPSVVVSSTPVPSTIVQPSSSIPGGGATATPTETPTPTVTVTPTVTPTSVPTVAPTLAPSEKKITAFSFKGIANAKGVVFEKIHTIYVKVPTGTDLKKVEPEIQFRGASIKPEAGVKKNFNNPVFYTVTALDKTKVKYVVIVGTESVVVQPPEIKPGSGYGPYGDIFDHWAEERMISMIENGAIAGYPDGSVKPDLDMTRAEVITTLVKAIGLEPAKDPKLKFADIKSIPTWAQGYIQVALEKGIVAGYPDNTYKANNKVTREEFLVMAMKAFNYEASKNTALKFKDAKQVSGWALGYVAKAIELAIIEGYKEDNTIKPNKKITRAEVMTIIDKCITLSGKK